MQEELNAAMSRIQGENRFFTQQLSDEYINTSGANSFLNAYEKKWLDSHGSIRIAYQDDFLSFCGTDPKTGELTGALKDYLASASGCLSNAKLDFQATAYPTAKAAMDALRSGEVDCMFPSNLSTSDGEAQDLIMTPSIMRTEVYAVVPKGDRNTFFQKEDVTAAIESEDPNYESVIKDHFPDWKTKKHPDMQACLQAVSDGEADCTLISNYQYNNLSRLCERYGLIPLATGKVVDFYIAVNLGDNDLYSILTKTTNLVNDAAINAALTRYSAEDARTSLADFIRDNPVASILVLLVIIAMIFVVIIQRRMIQAERKAAESQHLAENLSERVYVDALTRVRNKGGYDEYIRDLQIRMGQGEMLEFAIGIFDCDDLKGINDEFGHERGNIYLRTASRMICRIFHHSPVFRVGGDEFTVVMMGEDYQNRDELIRQFEKEQNEINVTVKPWERVSVSAGIAVFDPEIDRTVSDTSHRADQMMYENKQARKETN